MIERRIRTLESLLISSYVKPFISEDMRVSIKGTIDFYSELLGDNIYIEEETYRTYYEEWYNNKMKENEPADKIRELIRLQQYWIDVRRDARALENNAQRNIEQLSDSLAAARLEEKTGTALDIPPLKQNFREMIADKILRALDRSPR